MNLSTLFGGNKQSSGLFIPDNSGFKELTDEIPIKSINAISEHLGYHPDQVYSYYEGQESKSDISNVIVEVFSRNIVFVLTKDTVTKLDKKRVDNYLRNFTVKNVFNSYTSESILEDGIENKSLKIGFLARVLNIEDPEQNGMIFVESLGLYLFFIDGYLVNFQSSDGLNEWAKFWKDRNTNLFSSYEKTAKLYWGNDINKVIEEINIQADSWAKIPQAMDNEYITLHKTKFGTVNFTMLLVCHYNHGLSFYDFTTINHGRYKEIGVGKYKVDKFAYEFSEDGVLLKSYLAD